MASKTLLVPCIHLNGTGKDSLTRDLEEAYSSVSAAYDRVRKMEVNARDYYPYGAGAYETARKQHLERLTHLKNVMDEFDLLMDGIQDNAKEVTKYDE